MLEQSEKDFPNDYNPPARLALAYKAMKQYDEALAASDRALAKVYGPRKIAVLRVALRHLHGERRQGDGEEDAGRDDPLREVAAEGAGEQGDDRVAGEEAKGAVVTR